MDAKRRIEYLQVLGVDVWLPRRPNAAAAPPEAPLPAPVVETLVESTPRAFSIEARETREAREPIAAETREPPAPIAGREARYPSTAREPPYATPPKPVVAAQVAEPSVRPAQQTIPADARVLDGEFDAQWAALRTEVLTCTKCPLHASRTQGVFGVGDQRADWLVIGEAPGAEEDRRGEPFVGRGGQLLDAMLRGISLKRGDNVYIANILKSRPPNNRDPKLEEVSACIPYLMRQIALIRPKLILAVGRIAAQNLLATDAPLTRLRGRIHHFGELNTPLIVTYHPAYLLRSPGEKRKAWEDLKFARGLYRQLTAQAS